MRTALRLAVLFIAAVAAAPVVARAESPDKAADAPAAIRHPFLCADYSAARVYRVDTDGKIVWDYPAAQCQDVWLLASGNVLLSHDRGAKEVTPDKKVVWEYRSPDGSEVHTCQPLPDGGVLLCEGGTSRLVEVGRDGKVRKEVRIETKTQGAHGQFRVARKLADGHYLVTFSGENLVRELDADGKAVRTIPVPGNPYAALRLPGGNTLIACGDGHKLIEVDPQDKVVWKIEENDLPGNPLRFVAGIQRLPNGNTVVCNWGGHGFLGKQPLIFEVTPDKKVVWQVEDHKQFKAISGVQVLDVKGDVTKAEVLR